MEQNKYLEQRAITSGGWVIEELSETLLALCTYTPEPSGQRHKEME